VNDRLKDGRAVLPDVVAYPLRSTAHFYQTELRHLLRKQK
jgi:hypothetical protein